jgi:Trypsin
MRSAVTGHVAILGRLAARFAGLACLTLISCSIDPEAGAAARQATISGGSTVTNGAWPMLGWLDNGCSGVLLAPDLIVYAAHCGSSASSVWFGDQLNVQLDDDAGTASVVPAPGVTRVAVTRCGNCQRA